MENTENINLDFKKTGRILIPPRQVVLEYNLKSSSNINKNQNENISGNISNPQHTLVQYSLHQPPRSVLRELKLIFPELSLLQLNQMRILPLIFKTEHDMINATPIVNNERDSILDLVNINIQ